MIDHVDYLIAYAWHPASNAKELTAYALRKGVVVTNLGGNPRKQGGIAVFHKIDYFLCFIDLLSTINGLC